MKTGCDCRIVLSLTAAVLLLAMAVSLWSGNRLRYPDEEAYHGLAVRLLQQHAYVNEQGQPTVLRPPGYPFVLSALYLVVESPLAAKLVNAVALGLTAFLLSRLAASLGNGIAGRLAPLLVLGYPLFAYTASTLYPQTLGTLLLVAVIGLLFAPEASWKKAVSAGLLFGFLVLMIPAFMLWVPLLPAYRALTDWRGGQPWLRRAGVFLAASAVVVAPWTVRNYVQFKTFLPVSANAGGNLLLGNSPNTSPDSGVNVDISEYERQGKGLNEVEQDKFYRGCAVAYMKAHPGPALKLYAQKVLGYFTFHNRLHTSSENSTFRDAVLFVTYYPLLALALARLLLRRRYPLSSPEWFLYFLYFGNALLSAIFFTRIRFRVPLDALLVVLVAVFIGHLWAGRQRQRVEAEAVLETRA
jgi:hypothetical protein